MNIFEKLNMARIELQNKNLKKSGVNKFAGYTYFELCDFLPEIIKIFNRLRLFSWISYDKDLAKLTIVNTELPDEEIYITSPMEKANLKGCHDIQNLGAVETYQRRYLYVTALEILENDLLDSDKLTFVDNNPIKPGYVTEINLLLSETNSDKEKFLSYVGVNKVEDIKMCDYDKVIATLKAKKKGSGK